MKSKPQTDLERVVCSFLYDEPLPAGFDLALVFERVRDRGEWALLGRLAAHHMLQVDIARLRAKQAAILASLPRPPCH